MVDAKDWFSHKYNAMHKNENANLNTMVINPLTSRRQCRPVAISIVLSIFMTQAAWAENETLVDKERERCGEIIDMHLHPSNYSTVDPILSDLDMAGVSQGIVYAVYAANNTFLPDANMQVSQLINASDGRLYGLASLDTSGDWETTGKDELARLSQALQEPGFLGLKLAPPHTCLELNGTIIKEVIQTLSESSKPVVGIHTGTTPFCGEFGKLVLGYRGCCSPQYVDPSFLEELLAEYANVTFILLHSGFDFLPFNDTYFYNGTLVQESIDLATAYSNVWLEISAMFPEDYTGRPRNPTGTAVVQQIKDAGLANRVMWGSDANFPGIISTALEWGVEAMVQGGYSEEERCSALVKGSKDVFGIPDMSTQPPSITSSCSIVRSLLMEVFVTVFAASVLL